MAEPPSHQDQITLWVALLPVFSILGLLNASSVIGDRLSSGQAFHWQVPLATEMTGAYSALLLMPFLIWFMRRFMIDAKNWSVRIPLHLGSSVLFGGTCTLMMWGSRTLLWHALGWEPYNYGDLRFRFPMEYTKQLMAYMVIYGCVAGFSYVQRTHVQELRARDLEHQLAEARLAALKMQLNPHFLFNALNMISNYIFEDPKVADTMLSNLSDFLRLTLSRAKAQEVPLEIELGFLYAYLGIMSARFGDSLRVEIQIAPEAHRVLVPHLILQPLVENAILHCQKEMGHPGHVRASATLMDGRVALEVMDDGPGLAVSPEEALSGGVGLSNTAQRLKALYGNDHQLTFDRGPLGGLRVRMEFPSRMEAQEAAVS